MDLIHKAIIAIRRVGFTNTLRFIRAAQLRDQLEKQARCIPSQASLSKAPGNLREVDWVQSGGRFQFENSSLEIKFLAGDLVRVSWSPGKPPLPYAIAQQDWPPYQASFQPLDEAWQMCSDQLQVEIGIDGCTQFSDLAGNNLRRDLPPERSDPSILTAGEYFPEPVWRLRTSLAPETAIFGLGTRALPLNLRGKSLRMWNTDPGGTYGPGVDPLYMCIPVYLAVHQAGSYLVFFENPFPGTFNFPPGHSSEKDYPFPSNGKEGADVVFEGGMLRYYFIPGPPDRAFERYSQLTGRAPLPPRWALGYHQSRWGYQSEADIREVADGFEEHDLPMSAFHLDIDYMQEFRVFSVDEEKFPDLSGLARDLDRENIKLVTVLDPCVKVDPEFSLYREGLEKGIFCSLPGQEILQAPVWPGWSAFPDFTNPMVREWWGRQYSRLLSKGIAGIWHDMNEPATFAAWGDLTIPSTTIHAMEGRGGTHLEAHNLYGLLMNKAGQEGFEKCIEDKRPWLFSRSGWAGVARYAWNWTGDIESSWEALRQTVSTVLGLSLSGIPYSGSDIGGFSGVPGPELYLRWFQMAVFTPFFRTHSTKEVPPREPWRFKEPVLSIVREFLKMRYRLMPYLYTLAWECTNNGWPLVRPLFWPDGGDPRLWQVDDAFMLGDGLLVAPVLEPGAEARPVSLPSGDWFDFWDDKVYHGSTEVELPVCLERIPLLVRAGSLLPLEDEEILHLHFYPTEIGISHGSIYSDSGDGQGDWRLDKFASTQIEGDIEITRTGEGEFVFPYRLIRVHVHGRRLSRAWIDGVDSPVDGNILETGFFNRIRLSCSG